MPWLARSGMICRGPGDRQPPEWSAGGRKSLTQRRRDAVRIGSFGSYARGDWGVGSDLDAIIAVERSAEPFPRRAAELDATELPVPADLLVYTEAGWRSLPREGWFSEALRREAIWVYAR